MSKPSRDALFETLRRLLGESFALHEAGAHGSRLGRSHGIADGYMLALIDAGVASRNELGRLVHEERARRYGPATRGITPEPTVAEDSAAA